MVLVMSVFLLGAMGFGVDFSNLWFHQQKAQAAADAACQAGAMDLLEISAGTDTTTSAGFTPGTAFDCSSASSAAPCTYASLNAYAGAGLSAGSASNDVAVSFPSSVSGATTPPVGIAGNYPFMRVDITDRVQVFFSGLLTGSRTQDVHVSAKCGLVLEQSPVPIVVLDPKTADGSTLTVQGTPAISIIGGPTRSIEVNSPYSSAIGLGGNGSVDLSKGGPDFNGSSMATAGGPYSLATLLTGSTTFTPDSSVYYDPASAPLSDPFAQLPGITTAPPAGTSTNVAYQVNGCPDSGGCVEFTPGSYPGIDVKDQTAIFDGGTYYLTGELDLDTRSILRPSTVTTNGNGTMFYLKGNAGVGVKSNSGSRTVDTFPTSQLQCPGGSAISLTDGSGNPVTALSGNVLLGICSGTYGDPLGENRGMLVFQDRGATGAPVNFGGGGSLTLAGNIYVHNCGSATAGAGTSCSSTAYTDTFSLGGGSGSATYVLGDIIVDQLALGGNSTIAMQLNPTSAYYILKAELLQ
jgi:hypothetical protein